MKLPAYLTAFDLLGHQLDGFQIEKILGQGAVATVFQATCLANRETVALKLLKHYATVQQPIREKLQREFELTAVFNHPNILPSLKHGQLGGRDYLTMPLVPGQSLHETLRRGALDEKTAVHIAIQLAHALDYLGDRRIIHRDLKPANVLLTKQDQPLLIDFGLATFAHESEAAEWGQLFGTPRYMAPEQIVYGRSVDPRSDLYALGILLCELVTGHTPFSGAPRDILAAHVHHQATLPKTSAHVSPDVQAIILRALAKAPAERFQTGLEMEHALKTAVLTPPPKPKRRHVLPWLSPAPVC